MRGRALIVAVVTSALLGAGLLSGAGNVRAAGGADQAVAYQMDVAHDGNLSGDTLAPPLTKIWTRDLGGHVSYPLIAGGMVFVTVAGTTMVNGSSHNATTLYALDENSGNTVWSVGPVPSTFPWSALAYDNSTVFMLTYDGGLAAFDAATGATKWSTTLTGQSSFTAPPVAANGTLYTSGSGSGGTFYAVDESTGLVEWTDYVMNGDDSSPTISGGDVYAAYSGPQVYAFNATTGATDWRYNSGIEGGGGNTPVVANGDVYVRDLGVSANTGYIFPASCPTCGTDNAPLLGRFTADQAPAFSGSTGVMLGGGSGYTSGNILTASDWSDPANPQVKWTFGGDGGLDTAPIIVNNEVYIGSASGNLYALNLSNGHLDWQDTESAGFLAPNTGTVGQPWPGIAAGEGTLIAPADHVVSAYRTNPTISGAAVHTTEGSSFNGTVATFTSTNPNALGDTVSIDWGDGTAPSAGTVVQGNGGYNVTGSHTYADEGSYTITVTVTDANLQRTATSTAAVSDAALSSSGFVLSSATAGSAFTARLATIRDGNPGAAASDYTVAVNWGDGTSTSGSLASTGTPGSFDVSGTHTYPVATTYTVTVTVTDVGGSSTQAVSSVTANVPPTATKASVSASNKSNPYVSASAQAKGGKVSGSLQFDDPSTSSPTTAITSSSIKSIVKSGTNAETLYGTGTQNGNSISFTATVTSGPNTFRIQTSAGYDSGVRSISSARVS